jgi:hypothetical protein
VQVTSPLAPKLADAAPDHELLMVLPRTNLHVWRIAPPSAARLDRIRNDPAIGFVETMPAGTVAAVPVATEEFGSISAEDRATVDRLTAGAPHGSFRITAPRPSGLAIDLMETPLARRVAVKLPPDQSLVISRTSYTSIGTGTFNWSGHIVNGPGDANFVIRSLGITGNIHYRNDTYAVWPLASGRQLIGRVGPFPADHPPDTARE